MIDAECQQLHNGDYRFDDIINGGENGVFGFSANWGCIRGFCLDLLPWVSQRLSELKRQGIAHQRITGLCRSSWRLVFRPIYGVLSIGPNVGVAGSHLRCLHYRVDLYRFS